MKTVKSIIYVLLSGIVCYLSWLIFYFITPHIMTLSWLWMIIIFFILGGFIIPLISFLPAILASMINSLKSGSIIERIACILLVLFFCFSSCRLAWGFDFDYNTKHIVFAIMQNLIVLGLFWGLALSFTTQKNEES